MLTSLLRKRMGDAAFWLAGLIALIVAIRIFKYSDFGGHISIGLRILNKEIPFTINSIFYIGMAKINAALIYLGIPSEENFSRIITASSIVTIAMVVKYALTDNYLQNRMQAFLLLFAAPITFQYGVRYLGFIQPNVWHNTSTMALMPFAILLYTQSLSIIAGKRRSNLAFLAIILVNAIIKPSLLIVFVPTYGAIMGYRFILDLKEGNATPYKTVATFLPPLLAMSCILIIYFGTYSDGNRIGGNSIAFMPFHIARTMANISGVTVWEGVLFSVLFPLSTVLAVIMTKAKVPMDIVFSYLLLFFSLAFYYALAETGDRMNHGNFGWSYIPSMYLVFLSSIKFVENLGKSFWRSLALSAFYLHVLAGVIWVIKIVVTTRFINIAGESFF